MNLPNPFNITKAVDFSDEEIRDYWVDIQRAGGFLGMVRPSSPMPMLILGGKGSGKTHVMRYFSYPLQRLRNPKNVVRQIEQEGYLGVYFRCGGLNAFRFSGKGQDEEKWEAVFVYYMELWLSQLALQTVADAFANHDDLAANEQAICTRIVSLFDNPPFKAPPRILELIWRISCLQKETDAAVNNCAISRSLDLNIRVTGGRLIFGVPQILAQCLPALKKVLFLYIVDEFENLTARQQKYFNTLLREKDPPASFKIGSRLYGIKTFGTYSAGEENTEGSEYETLRLDADLRKTNAKYSDFARRLVARRLIESRSLPKGSADLKVVAGSLDSCFETIPQDTLGEAETSFVRDKYHGSLRPYVKSLRQELLKGLRGGVAPGVSTEGDVGAILSALEVTDYPLVEKANILLFYQEWSKGNNLREAAARIREDRIAYVQDPAAESRHKKKLDHFRGDLLAQLLRECGRKQRYLGMDVFIHMSCGLPRNLLIILKNIFKWAVFGGETPFGTQPVSEKSQQHGVLEGSEWFYRDARMTGSDGSIVRGGLDRLATLFREVRFADKPSECSLSSFSADLSRVTDEARRVIALAENYSLLVAAETGQRDRNTKRVDSKYQLSGMLAPRWDLPVYRRGVIALKPGEVNAIFDPARKAEFPRHLDARVGRMNAPFAARKDDGLQTTLPGMR